MKGLTDKVIVVTGGAGGIGSATCQRLAEAGAKIAVCDMNLVAAQPARSKSPQQSWGKGDFCLGYERMRCSNHDFT